MAARLALLIGLSSAFAAPAFAEPFELKGGDRVVWLGSTIIEREQRYGYWETMLTAHWPDRAIRFRNLGWSGDDVHGAARLAFDINNPALGLKRMVDLALAEKPTVIFICYGTNESFDGALGLDRFEKGYEKLLDALAPAKARIVLLAPPMFEERQWKAPDFARRKQDLGSYTNAVGALAAKRKLTFVDEFAQHYRPVDPLTDDGMHLTASGYAVTADNLRNGLQIQHGPSFERLEPLRQAIVAKNKLYFYRWRPQNETYLFGFRKHEQGKNAKEVVDFDPLIARAEQEIDRLKAGQKTTP